MAGASRRFKVQLAQEIKGALVYLETSAVNALAEDSILGPQVSKALLLRKVPVLISGIAEAELLQTPDRDRRESLLDVLRPLVHGRRLRILEDVGPLLRRSLEIFASVGGVDLRVYEHPRDTEDGLLDMIMSPPEDIAEKARREVEQVTAWYRPMLKAVREYLDGLLSNHVERQGFTEYARELLLDHDRLEDLFFRGVFKKVQHDLKNKLRGRTEKVLREVPPWGAFFGAMAINGYRSALKTRKHGRKYVPGCADFSQVAYLLRADFFVVEDFGLRALARQTNRLLGGKTRVVRYECFRDALFLQSALDG